MRCQFGWLLSWRRTVVNVMQRKCNVDSVLSIVTKRASLWEKTKMIAGVRCIAFAALLIGPWASGYGGAFAQTTPTPNLSNVVTQTGGTVVPGRASVDLITPSNVGTSAATNGVTINARVPNYSSVSQADTSVSGQFSAIVDVAPASEHGSQLMTTVTTGSSGSGFNAVVNTVGPVVSH